MFTKGKLLFLYCESLIHAGAGSSSGAIDLPIQRERITLWPVFQSSGVKGSLRDHYENKGCSDDELFTVFGPDPMKKGDPAENSGAVSFSDAMLLLFPVGSLKGTFAYVTCPLAVKRLQRSLEALGPVDGRITAAAGVEVKDEEILIPLDNEQKTYTSLLVLTSSKVVLEESVFDAKPSQELKDLADWIVSCQPATDNPWVKLPHRLAIVSDEMFKYFVQFSTEVLSRNRIDDKTGTIVDGGLWTEECLPRETLLYSVFLCCAPRKTVKGLLTDENVMQYVSKTHAPCRIWLGGDVTGGRGILRTFFSDGKQAPTQGGQKHEQ